MTDIQKEQTRRLSSEGFGYRKIATLLDLPMNTVKSYCKRQGITKQEVEPVCMSFCKACGLPIIQRPRGKVRLYCNDKCRNDFWNKQNTGTERECPWCHETFLAYGNRKFCSHSCAQKARYSDAK